MLSGPGGLKTDRSPCAGAGGWKDAVRELCARHRVPASARAEAFLGQGLYTVVRQPRNELLSDEELRGLAMSRALESSVPGKIADYTWDYFDAKTGKNSKPALNFVLAEKRLVSLLAEAVREAADLTRITVFDLAMTAFVSTYRSGPLPGAAGEEPPRLTLALYLPRGGELSVFGVFGGELCYSRVLRGYRRLADEAAPGAGDPAVGRLAAEILKINDDFFTSGLGLPPMSRLLLVAGAADPRNVALGLSRHFKRIVEVVPAGGAKQEGDAGYTVCGDPVIAGMPGWDPAFAPLLGMMREGAPADEKN